MGVSLSFQRTTHYLILGNIYEEDTYWIHIGSGESVFVEFSLLVATVLKEIKKRGEIPHKLKIAGKQVEIEVSPTGFSLSIYIKQETPWEALFTASSRTMFFSELDNIIRMLQYASLIYRHLIAINKKSGGVTQEKVRVLFQLLQIIKTIENKGVKVDITIIKKPGERNIYVDEEEGYIVLSGAKESSVLTVNQLYRMIQKAGVLGFVRFYPLLL